MTPPDTPLATLEAAARSTLAYLDYPKRAWTPARLAPDGTEAADVLVVGAGINGLAIAFLLAREKVARVRVIDAAAEGQEGPWLGFARMRWLRTPKELVGPDLGVAPLSFPAWYAARFGKAAWQALDKAPNAVWMEYLAWFRDTAGIAVENGTRLVSVEEGSDGLFACTLRTEAGETVAYARRVVLAMGVLGAGGAALPREIAALPSHLRAHSSDTIDFAALAGRHVAVIGAGASAFDNAAVALETGAAKVTLIARRAAIAQPNVKQAMEFAGFLRHYGELEDAQRFRLHQVLARFAVPPPPDSVKRCTVHCERFAMITSAPLLSVREEGGRAVLETARGSVTADFVIAATGFAVNMQARPELSAFAPRIATWADRFPAAAADTTLGAMPYLDGGFAYTAREAKDASVLGRIHDVGIASVPSVGPVCVGLNGMKFGPDRVVRAITRSLFLEDAETHVSAVEAFAATAAPAGDDPLVI
ncbi:FAD/NAD(P)-binding protein [Elioraea rosea]|uniref:FAD/NAD(P)-binding protein n=1 Tax=Elioraea rosea TaxID=2492390 RepID=UPI001182D6C7|nr:NAD(P)/FAD-dependent oxidoreductase [Elioraea rosea]